MAIVRCALGVIKKRGEVQVRPQVIQLGNDEESYLRRHIEKARATSNDVRANFTTASKSGVQLAQLASAADVKSFETTAKLLQEALAEKMKVTPNALDCVFAVISYGHLGSVGVSLLKLDAVIEAARFEQLTDGTLTFEVLQELLPKPGDLQKGLSWPDEREGSDVIVVDRNAATALYFEEALGVRVSMRSRETEKRFLEEVIKSLPPSEVGPAIESLSENSGYADELADEIAASRPALEGLRQRVTEDDRPPGHIRVDRLKGLPCVFKADGIEVRVPYDRLGAVEVRETADGWQIVVTTRMEPTLST